MPSRQASACGRFVAGSEHVRSPGFPDPYLADRQAESLAHDNGERHGSIRYAGDDKQAGSEHGSFGKVE